ncbi:helix-turn-helix domain-containing protein [Cupriavidus sp. TMH.W2]|uniref:helix-turn-helix domain-containing protein n=1 Tax=Cupriavidus sp. TMH.W2 TaxID=3434465 RepID=UPI003D77934F
MKTIHSERYAFVVAELRKARLEQKVTQSSLAELLRKPQSYVAKVELLERRLDVVEVVDWLHAIGLEPAAFFRRFEWW